MANRYTYTNIIKEADTNKSYLQSTIYPKIKASDTDFYIISEAGDRLDLLAKKYYDNTNLWWVIAVANNLNDANFFVKEGLQLRIPQNVAKISKDLEKTNK
jgi:nucleoid-associated protein YgaU